MKSVRMLVAGAALLCSGLAAAHGGLLDVSVYDRSEARRLPVYWHEGRAYVAGKPGNEYQVSLRNRGAEDVLAVVSVDGVNVITGETADPQQSGYVLTPRRTLDIQGWRRSMAQTAAFYFTSLPDSYAGRTGRPHDVGVIGVAVFRKKHVPPPAPISRSESSKPSADAAGAGPRAAEASPQRDDKLGTGHGRHETSHAYYTSFERASRAPAEMITLYYDSHQNLLARGIIAGPIPVAPHVPRPFPGFVPDPRG
jgi:hypothetical protein